MVQIVNKKVQIFGKKAWLVVLFLPSQLRVTHEPEAQTQPEQEFIAPQPPCQRNQSPQQGSRQQSLELAAQSQQASRNRAPESSASLLKDRRRRSEVGEWELIKIPRGNLIYVTEQTQRASHQARSTPYSYRKANYPQNRVKDLENIGEDNNRCKQNHVQDYDDKNQFNAYYTFY
jgi:hypothetical protein